MYTGYFAETSNRGDWIEAIQLIDVNSGDVIDITGCTVQIAVRNMQSKEQVLSGSTDDGTVTLPDLGVFMWTFLESKMNALCPAAYEVGVRISRDDRTVQLVIGAVNVSEGIVDD